MSDQSYRLHHLCIYDENPRENVWAWLRWYHAIPQYYWGGEEFHLTDEGHVDYTFLGCGSAFQVQLESPPYQFEYERTWYSQHGSAVNHICWIVPDARATVNYLLASGCEERMPYEEFGVYRGFVCADPEGRWIEIMEYIDDFKSPDVEFRPFGIPGLQLFGPTQLTNDLAGMERWYQDVLGLRTVNGSAEAGIVFMADDEFGPDRNIAMILAEPSSEAERELFERHGPLIVGINHQAVDVERADSDAVAAGFQRLSELGLDERTGLLTSTFREPSGNLIFLRAVHQVA
jgi:catechol 2,3-dioxygenase-like lactoylglutathione lyase family enzyme